MKKILYLIIISLLFSCQVKENQTEKNNDFREIQLKYAKTFRLLENNTHYKMLVINESDQAVIADFEFTKAQEATHKIALFSSSSVGYLDELNCIDRVKGVEKLNTIYNAQLQKAKANNELKEYLDYSLVNPEKLRKDGINTLFYSIFSAQLSPIDQKMEQLEITAVPLSEWKEQHPLGKAEWIKVYGVVLGCYKDAVEKFDAIEKNYLAIQQVEKQVRQPTVFANTMFQDIWYLPGGASFMAKFITDAHGDYVLKADTTTGSQAFTFEQIYRAYKDADKWINIAERNKKELLSTFQGYQHFKAFKTNQMYTFANEPTRFFEESPVKPHLLLRDLQEIFWSDNPQDLYFYQQIK